MNRSRRSAQIFGIEQLERAGGGVAGVLERLLAVSPPQFVKPGELGVGHEDLAADFEQGRGAAMKRQGDVPDSAQVGRDVVAPLAVAAGRAQHELAFLVTQRDGHAVHLELDHVCHRLARVQASTDPGIPFPHLFVIVRVVDREHRHGMRHARELGQRRSADSLRRTVGTYQLRMFGLQLHQPRHQAVVFAIADLGRGVEVVEPVMPVDFVAQLFNLVFDLLRSHRRPPGEIDCRTDSEGPPNGPDFLNA